MYVPGLVPAALVQGDSEIEKPDCKPGLVLTGDQKGQMNPMATGVMVVKDVDGKACSHVL